MKDYDCPYCGDTVKFQERRKKPVKPGQSLVHTHFYKCSGCSYLKFVKGYQVSADEYKNQPLKEQIPLF